MSEELTFGLSDLNITDDLDVAMDNDTYQDQASPAPPVAGNYLLRAISLKPRTKEGKPVVELSGNKEFPIFVLGMVEIVDGLGEGVTRKVGLFQDVKTKPYDRYGTPASGIGDLTRAYGTRSWSGLDPNNPDSGISVLREVFEAQQTFPAQLDWEVYDKAFVEAAMAQTDLVKIAKENRTDDQKKLVNQIYREARVRGMRFFPYNENSGKFSSVLVRKDVTFKHPVTGSAITVTADQRALEARSIITRYFPQVDFQAGRVKIGPLNVQPPAQVAA